MQLMFRPIAYIKLTLLDFSSFRLYNVVDDFVGIVHNLLNLFAAHAVGATYDHKDREPPI